MERSGMGARRRGRGGVGRGLPTVRVASVKTLCLLAVSKFQAKVDQNVALDALSEFGWGGLLLAHERSSNGAP